MVAFDLCNRRLQIGHAAIFDAFALVGHAVFAAGQSFAQGLQVFWCRSCLLFLKSSIGCAPRAERALACCQKC